MWLWVMGLGRTIGRTACTPCQLALQAESDRLPRLLRLESTGTTAVWLVGAQLGAMWLVGAKPRAM